MTYLYLIRHAENIANLTKEFSSFKIDYNLTPKGVLQAHQTAEALTGRRIEAVYASPLRRTRETAQAITTRLGVPLTVMEDFREVHVGALEGRRDLEGWRIHNDVIADWHAGHPHSRFPEGENYLELFSRLRAGLRKVASLHPNGRAAVVGHGGMFSFCLPDLCDNMERSLPYEITCGNASITEIEVWLEDGQPKAHLVRWSQVSHLRGEAALLVNGWPEEASKS